MQWADALLRKVDGDPSSTISFDYDGHAVSFYLPLGQADFIQREILITHNFFEHGCLEKLRQLVDLKGAHVVDAGANIGNHTVFFATVCGVGRCISFEPNPEAAEILERNVALNDSGVVEVRREGLGKEPGYLAIKDSVPGNLGATRFRSAIDGIRCVTIDSLSLPRLDFIKIDVEEMAPAVLYGAVDTLRTFRPVLWLELFPHERDEGDKALRHIGYRERVVLDEYNSLYEPT